MEYHLAQETWKDPQVTSIHAPEVTFLSEFPLTFVRQGGINTWGFVVNVVLDMLEPISGVTLCSVGGEAVSLPDEPWAGDFTLVPNGEYARYSRRLDDQKAESSISFARGPEYFRKGIAPNTEAGQSTRSRSKSRSTPNQVFRWSLNTLADSHSSLTHLLTDIRVNSDLWSVFVTHNA